MIEFFLYSPDYWTKVDAILEYSNLLETKYFGLQILEQLIQTRWKALPRDQCEGIKGYIVSMILDISADAVKSENMKLLLQKLNLVLVQVRIFKICFNDCNLRHISQLIFFDHVVYALSGVIEIVKNINF